MSGMVSFPLNERRKDSEEYRNLADQIDEERLVQAFKEEEKDLPRLRNWRTTRH